MAKPLKVAGALALGAGSLAVTLLLRKRAAGPAERIEVYLADGSKVRVDPGSPEFGRLIPLARQALRAAG